MYIATDHGNQKDGLFKWKSCLLTSWKENISHIKTSFVDGVISCTFVSKNTIAIQRNGVGSVYYIMFAYGLTSNGMGSDIKHCNTAAAKSTSRNFNLFAGMMMSFFSQFETESYKCQCNAYNSPWHQQVNFCITEGQYLSVNKKLTSPDLKLSPNHSNLKSSKHTVSDCSVCNDQSTQWVIVQYVMIFA